MTDDELMDKRDRLHDERKINRVEVLGDMDMLNHIINELEMDPDFALKAYIAFLDRYEAGLRLEKLKDIMKLAREKSEDCDDEHDDCGCFCGCCNDDMY